MKHMKFFKMLLVAIVAVQFTSCNSDFEEESDWICILPPDWGQPVFTLDSDSIPHFNALNPMSMADFEARVVGYGWHCNALQRINNDGFISSDNLLGQYFGLGPTHYYFDKDILRKFMYIDHLGYINGGMMYLDQGYTYDDETAHIHVGNYDELQLFSYFDSSDGKVFLYCICLFGIDSAEVPRYCVATFQRMTNAELNDVRNLYSVNFADYLSN